MMKIREFRKRVVKVTQEKNDEREQLSFLILRLLSTSLGLFTTLVVLDILIVDSHGLVDLGTKGVLVLGAKIC